jgi:hypothetical protein
MKNLAIAGTLLLALGCKVEKTENQVEVTTPTAAETQTAARSAADRVREGAQEIGTEVKEGAETVQSSEAGQRIAEGAKEIGRGVKHGAGEAAEAAGEALQRAGQRAQDSTKRDAPVQPTTTSTTGT